MDAPANRTIGPKGLARKERAERDVLDPRFRGGDGKGVRDALKRLALHQPRQVAGYAHGVAHEEALQTRRVVDGGEAEVARQF